MNTRWLFLGWLLAVAVVGAAGYGAMQWFPMWPNPVVLFTLGAALIIAGLRRAGERTFWLGFVVFGTTYLLCVEDFKNYWSWCGDIGMAAVLSTYDPAGKTIVIADILLTTFSASFGGVMLLYLYQRGAWSFVAKLASEAMAHPSRLQFSLGATLKVIAMLAVAFALPEMFIPLAILSITGSLIGLFVGQVLAMDLAQRRRWAIACAAASALALSPFQIAFEWSGAGHPWPASDALYVASVFVRCALVGAALPIDKVAATPFQRDLSETHCKRLSDTIGKLGRYIDPIVAVPVGDRFWTPNGRHRLEAMTRLGARTITALVLPDAAIQYNILALNIEKAHNLREKSLVFRPSSIDGRHRPCAEPVDRWRPTRGGATSQLEFDGPLEVIRMYRAMAAASSGPAARGRRRMAASCVRPTVPWSSRNRRLPRWASATNTTAVSEAEPITPSCAAWTAGSTSRSPLRSPSVRPCGQDRKTGRPSERVSRRAEGTGLHQPLPEIVRRCPGEPASLHENHAALRFSNVPPGSTWIP